MNIFAILLAKVTDKSRIDGSSNVPELPDLNSVMIERSFPVILQASLIYQGPALLSVDSAHTSPLASLAKIKLGRLITP